MALENFGNQNEKLASDASAAMATDFTSMKSNDTNAIAYTQGISSDTSAQFGTLTLMQGDQALCST